MIDFTILTPPKKSVLTPFISNTIKEFTGKKIIIFELFYYLLLKSNYCKFLWSINKLPNILKFPIIFCILTLERYDIYFI